MCPPTRSEQHYWPQMQLISYHSATTGLHQSKLLHFWGNVHPFQKIIQTELPTPTDSWESGTCMHCPCEYKIFDNLAVGSHTTACYEDNACKCQILKKLKQPLITLWKSEKFWPFRASLDWKCWTESAKDSVFGIWH